MTRPTPKAILMANRRAFDNCKPRSRDRLRYRVKVMEIVIVMRKKSRSA